MHGPRQEEPTRRGKDVVTLLHTFTRHLMAVMGAHTHINPYWLMEDSYITSWSATEKSNCMSSKSTLDQILHSSVLITSLSSNAASLLFYPFLIRVISWPSAHPNMPKINKRKAQLKALAGKARYAKKLKNECESVNTANERGPGEEPSVNITGKAMDSGTATHESQCERGPELLPIDDHEQPTDGDWKHILGTMKSDTDVSIKYARGCQENRITTWRHRRKAKEQVNTTKDCPKITSFFVVSSKNAGSLAVVKCVCTEYLYSAHSLRHRNRAIKLGSQKIPARTWSEQCLERIGGAINGLRKSISSAAS